MGSASSANRFFNHIENNGTNLLLGRHLLVLHHSDDLPVFIPSRKVFSWYDLGNETVVQVGIQL